MKNHKRQFIKSIFAFFTILLSCFLLNSSLSATEKPVWENWNFPSNPVRGGDYRIAATVDIGLMNPHHWPINDFNVIMQIRRSLLCRKKANCYANLIWHQESANAFKRLFKSLSSEFVEAYCLIPSEWFVYFMGVCNSISICILYKSGDIVIKGY